MATKNFDQGALVRVYGVFTNSAGTAIDPTTVKIAYRADAIGTTTIWTYGTDAQVIRSATGTYYADIDSNESPGRYEWNIYSVGTGQAADNGDFYIRRVLTTPAPPSDPMTTLPATNVTFIQAGASAITRDVRDRLRDTVHAADFDGANLGARINNAIASFSSAGGVIDARSFTGVQTATTTITDGSKPIIILLGSTTLTFSGISNYCINLQTAGSAVIGTTPGESVIISASNVHGVNVASYTTVRNVTLRGTNNSAHSASSGINGGSSTGVVVENNIIEDWGAYGINAGGSSPYWLIHGNVIREVWLGGILYSSDHGTVSANVISSTQSNAVDFGGGSWNVCSNNNIYSCGLGTGFPGGDCFGILLANGNNNTVTNNVVDTTRCQGIIIKASGSGSTNYNVISGNVVTNGTGAVADGISLDGSSAGTMRGNVVTGNVCRSNARSGIIIDGGTGTAQENLLVGNICELNTGTGLIISGANAVDNIAAAIVLRSNGTDTITTTSSIRTVQYGCQTTTRGTFHVGDHGLSIEAAAFANLGTPSDGVIKYCVDCTKATPCAAAGGGAFAFRIGGAWECNP